MSPLHARIKLFADGADLKSIVEMASKEPHIRGFTTNPSLMKKAGVTDYRAFCKELLSKVTDKPISFEVFADDFAEMKRQGLEIASWGKNVYVKIPVSNCEGQSAIPLIKELSQQGIQLNVTAILTLRQVHEVTAALRGGAPSVVSVFAGRIADTGRDPVPMMRASLELCQEAGSQIELLWASSRELYNIVQAAEMGCHIITVTPEILKKLSMEGQDLSVLSLDTVRAFRKDALAVGYQL